MITLVSLLFFLLPILAFPLLIVAFLLDKNMLHKKIYSIFIAIEAAIILYYFIPDPTKDLSRYYTIMNRLSFMSIGDFWIYLTSRVEPIANIYFYFFSKIGNHSWIMVGTTLISYFLINYVLFDYQKKRNINNQDFNMIYIFMLCTFYLVDDITGIRFCLARLIFFVALYLDICKNNKTLKVKLLYLLSPLIHSSCIIFLIIRILCHFIKYKFNLKIFLVLVICSISPQIIMKIAHTASNIPFFSSLSAKAEEYLSLSAGFYPMFVVQIIIMLFLFFCLLYVRNRCDKNMLKYANYILIILSIALLFVRSTSLSTRFIRASITFSLPLLMEYLNSLKSKNKLLIYLFMLGICVISLAFQVSHLTVEIHYGTLFEEGLFRNLFALLFG